MQWAGNLFTHYHYTTTDIEQRYENDLRIIRSAKSGFIIEIDSRDNEIPLPAGSPFSNWKEARRFAGPLPFTFTYNPRTKTILTIEGVRQNWHPEPLRIVRHQFPFLDSLHLENAVLANAFMVANVPYYWKKGKTEIWKKREDHSRVQ